MRAYKKLPKIKFKIGEIVTANNLVEERDFKNQPLRIRRILICSDNGVLYSAETMPKKFGGKYRLGTFGDHELTSNIVEWNGEAFRRVYDKSKRCDGCYFFDEYTEECIEPFNQECGVCHHEPTFHWEKVGKKR